MNPVEILPVQGALVLRARGSELLITAPHVSALYQYTTPQEFMQYFNESALVNRSARKLFQAWLRKDAGLWRRVYKAVREHPNADEVVEVEAPAVEEVAAAPVEEVQAEVQPAAEQPAAKLKKKAAKKSVKKVTKKAAAKTTKKAAKKTTKKADTKTTAKKATKTTQKKSVKKAKKK